MEKKHVTNTKLTRHIKRPIVLKKSDAKPLCSASQKCVKLQRELQRCQLWAYNT